MNLFAEQMRLEKLSRQQSKVVPIPTQNLSQEVLKEYLNYDKCSGVFTWKKSPAKNVDAGMVAGSKDKNGYLVFQLKGRLYKAHRLAWLYVYGVMPDGEIDHKNGIPFDNRIENLRECTHADNQQNKGLRINNKSGHVGVSWYKAYNKWQAQINVNKVAYKLGYFKNKQDAINAYNEAKKSLHTFAPEVRKTSRFLTDQNVRDIKSAGLKVFHKPTKPTDDDLPPEPEAA